MIHDHLRKQHVRGDLIKFLAIDGDVSSGAMLETWVASDDQLRMLFATLCDDSLDCAEVDVLLINETQLVKSFRVGLAAKRARL